MPRFTRQGSRPLTAAAYEILAGKAQDLAENVVLAARSAHREGASVRDKQRLTRAIHSLSMHCRRLSERHRGMSYAQVVAEDGAREARTAAAYDAGAEIRREDYDDADQPE